MPHVFRQGPFSCPLKSTRCLARTKGRHPQRCSRVTFRHPFCLQHSQIHMGVDIRLSRIPNAGCGLFAHRNIRRGDIVGPYTGDMFPNMAALLAARSGHTTVYTMQTGAHGRMVDGACVRGVIAYANEPRRTIDHANLKRFTTTIRATQRALFGPEDPNTAMCAVLTPTQCGRANPFHALGWRRIPAVFLTSAFMDQSHVWLMASRDIVMGDELLLLYRSGGALTATIHSTMPRPCAT